MAEAQPERERELRLLELIRQASGGYLDDDHVTVDSDGHVNVRLETMRLDLTDLLDRLAPDRG